MTDGSWPASVPVRTAVQVIRAAKRFADALRAEWIVVFVDRGPLPNVRAGGARLAETLRLAEQLGAETVTLTGERISEEILTHARTRNVSKIVLGKSADPRWKRIVTSSIVDALVRGSRGIDVYITTGEEAARFPSLPHVAPRAGNGPPMDEWGCTSSFAP